MAARPTPSPPTDPLALDVGVATSAVHGMDRYLVESDARLFAACDGVGPYKSAGEAAELVVKVLRRRLAGLTGPLPSRERVARLCGAINHAQDVSQMVRRWGETTCTAAWLGPHGAAWTSVGDSRLYHLHGADLHQISVDETDPRHAHVLTNYVGKLRFRVAWVTHQRGWLTLAPADALILTTDGIHGSEPADFLTADELAAAMANQPTAQTAADALLAAGRKHDDRTAIVVRVLS